MAIIYLFEGNDLNLISVPKIFILLFVNISPIGDFAILDVSDRLGKLRQIFSNVGLSLVKSTLVLAPLTFKEADTRYLFDSDFADAQKTI